MASTLSTSVPTHEATSDESELVALVSRVYRVVWEEYHTWALQNSEDALKNSARTSYTRPPPLCREVVAESPPQAPELSDDLEAFTITDLDTSGSVKETFEVSSRPITVDKVLRPYPPYESCTPISRNIMVGDDPDYLPFIPFSDDPSYDYRYDIGEHKYFAWPVPNADPDSEVITYETTRRLVVDHKISYEDIDETELLPFSTEEIRKFHRKRDFPRWRDPKDLAPLPNPSISAAQGPKEITNYFLSTFCSNLNCVTGFCTTHLETQLPSTVPPRIPYSKLGDIVQEPCGRDCFMQPISAENSVGTFWQPADTEFLFSFLDYAPDSSSCDLAPICRKPCREIHRQRAKYRSRSASSNAGAKNGKVYNEHSSEYTPNLPCRHDGPCDTRSGCACALNKAHCHTRCGCFKSCPRRWKGCSCAKSRSGKLCGTNKCSCYMANIECDPEVCLPCGARGESSQGSVYREEPIPHLDENSTMCKNVSIQRGYSKRTEVRESKWGLGLFMLESCDEGDLIAEYVGELICEPTFDSRNAHTNHRGRSYVFKLNPTFSVDGANAGNATRYINHSPNANCGTTVCLVNGEHRVGIYAATRLEKGDELFINYGPKFFISSSGSPKGGPNLSAEAEGTSLELPAFVMPTYEHASDATYSEGSDVSMEDGSEAGEP